MGNGLKKEKMKGKIFHLFLLQPITRGQILDSSNLNKFADDNFTFDKNGGKLSKWVENTVGKGEIARYEQFLLFPQCFQKAYNPGVSKGVIVWEWVNFFRTKCILGMLNAFSICNQSMADMGQQFLLFPDYFLTFQMQISIISINFFCHLQNLQIWTLWAPWVFCIQNRTLAFLYVVGSD